MKRHVGTLEHRPIVLFGVRAFLAVQTFNVAVQTVNMFMFDYTAQLPNSGLYVTSYNRIFEGRETSTRFPAPDNSTGITNMVNSLVWSSTSSS